MNKSLIVVLWLFIVSTTIFIFKIVIVRLRKAENRQQQLIKEFAIVKSRIDELSEIVLKDIHEPPSGTSEPFLDASHDNSIVDSGGALGESS